MSGRPDSFMPLYIGDYLADTAHLSTAEHGAYLLLLMHYWRTGAALVDDDSALQRIARMSRAEWKASKATIRAFFKPAIINAEMVLTHTRVEIELHKAGVKYASRKAVSDAANAARKAKREAVLQGGHQTKLEPSQPQPQPQSSNEDKKEPAMRAAPTEPESVPKPIRKVKSALPEPFPDEDGLEEAQAFWASRGRFDLLVEDEALKFRAHHTAHGKRMADWSAAWRTWFHNALEFNKQPKVSAHDKGTVGAAIVLAKMESGNGSGSDHRARALGDAIPPNGHGRAQVVAPVRDVPGGLPKQEPRGDPLRLPALAAKS